VSVVPCPQLLISRQREATAGAAYKAVSEQSAALARQHALSLADIQRVTGEAEEAEAELDTRFAFLTRCARYAPSLADMLRAQVELCCCLWLAESGRVAGYGSVCFVVACALYGRKILELGE
jgi:hypothetical protein